MAKIPREVVCVVLLSMLVACAHVVAAEQQTFASPEAAVSGMVEAVKTNNESALQSVLGPAGSKLISSGDEVADTQSRAAFMKAYTEAHRLLLNGDTQALLVIGKDEWPLPIPLVKSNDAWRFDTQQGEQEILARRIGRNELAAMQVCLAIVDAEREYATEDIKDDRVLAYAAKFVSTPGKHDGLYWETTPDEPSSPLGPLLAAATRDGYLASESSSLAPFHGYYYRILTKQGKDAPGGAYDYVVEGKMIGGFAVIAYPARYGASGIMSFMANQDGVIYEKDLGENTEAIAAEMTAFNPDSTWKQP